MNKCRKEGMDWGWIAGGKKKKKGGGVVLNCINKAQANCFCDLQCSPSFSSDVFPFYRSLPFPSESCVNPLLIIIPPVIFHLLFSYLQWLLCNSAVTEEAAAAAAAIDQHFWCQAALIVINEPGALKPTPSILREQRSQSHSQMLHRTPMM